MSGQPRSFVRPFDRPRSISLAETLVSIVLVGGLLVVSLDLLSDAVAGQQGTSDRGRGILLAQQLMTEILEQPYDDPDQTTVLGREVGEDTGTRDSFDDVDDYHDWDSSPPTEKDGTEIPNLTGWSRSATVRWVDADDQISARGTDTGVKEITVTVRHKNARVASMMAIRTRAADPIAADLEAPIGDPGP